MLRSDHCQSSSGRFLSLRLELFPAFRPIENLECRKFFLVVIRARLEVGVTRIVKSFAQQMRVRNGSQNQINAEAVFGFARIVNRINARGGGLSKIQKMSADQTPIFVQANLFGHTNPSRFWVQKRKNRIGDVLGKSDRMQLEQRLLLCIDHCIPNHALEVRVAFSHPFL